MTLSDKLIELERLSSEVLEELQSVPTKPDVRSSKYAGLNHRIIAAQVLSNIRYLMKELGVKE
jgi:hypothetical protein